MKKFISFFCLSIFICISILKPIKASAYQVSDQYINGPITNEEYQDLVTAGALAGILSSGAEIVVPEAGIADLLLDLYNFAIDSDIGNAIWEYCTDPNGLKRDVNTIRYYIKGQPNYTEDFYNLGLNAYFNILGKDFLDQYEVSDNIINTNPDINYLTYISIINGSTFNYQYYLSDNWISSLSNSNLANNSQYTFTAPLNSVSYYQRSNNSLSYWNNSNYKNGYIASFYDSDQSYSIHATTLSPLSIYINLQNDIYYVTTSTMNNVSICKDINSNNSIYEFRTYYYPNNLKFEYYLNGSYNQLNNLSFYYNSTSLEDCFKVLAMNFRNVNIYVNGDPWSIITQPPEPIQIGGNTYITGTDTPINYGYPNGAWFDPAYLLHLLEEIDFNTKHTLSWVDIAPAFFDDNDQMALYTILVHRNDYDNLVLEQYGTNRLTQNKGLLFPKSELEPYTETSSFITQSSISLIPNDILLILGGCGVLILIAFLINRLLE